MNFSAEKASRKWSYGAFGRSGAAMVTVAALVLVLGAQAGPAHAARRSRPASWGDLFGEAGRSAPRLRTCIARGAAAQAAPRRGAGG